MFKRFTNTARKFTTFSMPMMGLNRDKVFLRKEIDFKKIEHFDEKIKFLEEKIDELKRPLYFTEKELKTLKEEKEDFLRPFQEAENAKKKIEAFTQKIIECIRSSTLEMKVCGEFEEFPFLEPILKEYGVDFEKPEYSGFQGVSTMYTLIFPEKLTITSFILNKENEEYDEWRYVFHLKILLAYQKLEEDMKNYKKWKEEKTEDELLKSQKIIKSILTNNQERTFFKTRLSRLAFQRLKKWGNEHDILIEQYHDMVTAEKIQKEEVGGCFL